MTKIYLLCLMLICSMVSTAQDFEITSVESLPNDFSAREEMKADHNDRQCALLRMATQNIAPEQREGFAFKTDLGSEIVERANRNGEIWLWVSPGLKYLRIMHRDMGQYELHLLDHVSRVEALHTYKVTIRGTEQGKDRITQQYLMFQIMPANALLEVDGQLWSVDADGTAMKYVDFGTYSYRVMASDYFTETGKVTVDDPENTKIVPVTLKPNFAEITLAVDADAEIWVNNQKKGTHRWTGSLGNGTYKIECKQANHETSMVSKEITPSMNGQTITLPTPTPIYGSLNIESTHNLATIYIDGKEVGKTPKSIPQIIIGDHELKLTMDGYADYKETITIAKGERKKIKAEMKRKEVDDQQMANSQMKSSSSTEDFSDLTFTVNGISFTMKPVEGGSFKMGNNNSNATDGEKCLHNVTVNSYLMGETEVTQALWKAVMGTKPSQYGSWEKKYGRGDEYPAYLVNYYDIIDFLRKLNHLTGKSFRLPTEAEWEYAARGGRKSKGTRFAGSNNIDIVGWYWKNSGDKGLIGDWDKNAISANHCRTHPVKTKEPNELGLYDMSGNVWEWCQDWYAKDYYSKSPSANPQGPSSGSGRIIRGGCWSSDLENCDVSIRSYDEPEYSDRILGFRLCLSLTGNDPVNNSGQSSIQQTSSTIPEGALLGKFSINPTQKVYFSKGNLQYQAFNQTWRFAEHQWDVIGDANKFIASSNKGWIDLFGWGTSGWDGGNSCYRPWDSNNEDGCIYGPSCYGFKDNFVNADWGVYNAIINGGKQKGVWRTLTNGEWVYLFDRRVTSSGIRFAMACVNNVNGIVLLPDNWNSSVYSLRNTNKYDAYYSSNIISLTDWTSKLEANGAVFLPAAGQRYGSSVTEVGSCGSYWSASASHITVTSFYIFFRGTDFPSVNPDGFANRQLGFSVRLVCPVEN